MKDSHTFECSLTSFIQDLDVLCLTTYPGGAEAIKQRLCEENDKFYTRPARNRKDPWKVLYWDTGSNDPGFRRIKVDILVPGVMNLPHIPTNFIVTIHGIPCAPLHLLLLHKLQAWDDRCRSSRPHVRAKIPGDIEDIEDLLFVANQRGLNLLERRPYITDSFHVISCRRVEEFVCQYPRYRQLWADLGLECSNGSVEGDSSVSTVTVCALYGVYLCD